MPRLWAVGVFAIYELIIILLGFHSLLDIASTLLAVAPAVWLIHFWSSRKSRLESVIGAA